MPLGIERDCPRVSHWAATVQDAGRGAPEGGGRGGAHRGARSGGHCHAALRAHRGQGAQDLGPHMAIMKRAPACLAEASHQPLQSGDSLPGTRRQYGNRASTFPCPSFSQAQAHFGRCCGQGALQDWWPCSIIPADASLPCKHSMPPQVRDSLAGSWRPHLGSPTPRVSSLVPPSPH